MMLDFTAVLSAFDGVGIVAALAAIAAIKILPGVARWGFSKVINWFSLPAVSDFSVPAVSDPVQSKQSDVKKRAGGVRSASAHPAFAPVDNVSQPAASNLEPESRFRVFGAIFGFFGGFFSKFFSFFHKRK